MLPVTHLLAPIVLLLAYWLHRGRPIRPRLFLFAGLAGVLPDLLNLHIRLAGRTSWSHSLLVLVPLGAATLLAEDRVQQYLFVLTAGFSTHILLDIVSNPYNFLYPLPFDPSYPALGNCGLELAFACWYAIDVMLVIVFTVLIARSLSSAGDTA